MRDNVKSGALTEVTFYILSSLLFNLKHGYAVMSVQLEGKNEWGRTFIGSRHFIWCINSMQEKGWIELFGDSEGRKKSILSL